MMIKTMIFWLKNIVGHGYTRLSFSMIEGVYSKRILGVFKTYMMITIMKKKFENYELIVTWCHWQVPYPKGIYMHTWSQTKWSGAHYSMILYLGLIQMIIFISSSIGKSDWKSLNHKTKVNWWKKPWTSQKVSRGFVISKTIFD